MTKNELQRLRGTRRLAEARKARSALRSAGRATSDRLSVCKQVDGCLTVRDLRTTVVHKSSLTFARLAVLERKDGRHAPGRAATGLASACNEIAR